MQKTNQKMTEKKHERIFERYLYWTETQRMRFDDTIRRLAEDEFFLSEDYVIRIIKKEMAKAEADGASIPRQKYLSVNL